MARSDGADTSMPLALFGNCFEDSAAEGCDELSVALLSSALGVAAPAASGRVDCCDVDASGADEASGTEPNFLLDFGDESGCAVSDCGTGRIICVLKLAETGKAHGKIAPEGQCAKFLLQKPFETHIVC